MGAEPGSPPEAPEATPDVTADRMHPVERFAVDLVRAADAARPIEPLALRQPPLERQHAYAVQLALVDIRTATGAAVVGKKIGLTSRAMQQLLNVDEPDFGHLFDDMRVPDDGTIPIDRLIAPKIEPEIAFIIGERLPGRRTTPHDVLRCTSHVAPALEVVDSRIVEWRISWSDTVADNGSSARFVVADRGHSPLGMDLAGLRVSMTRNGVEEASGSMSEVLGNPLRAVCWLAAQLEEFGLGIEAGDVILPGSPLRAMDVRGGDEVRADFGPLGDVSVTFG